VSFDQLPEDMKKYIRPPAKTKAKKDEGEKKVAKTATEAEIKETQIDIIEDKDLDFTK